MVLHLEQKDLRAATQCQPRAARVRIQRPSSANGPSACPGSAAQAIQPIGAQRECLGDAGTICAGMTPANVAGSAKRRWSRPVDEPGAATGVSVGAGCTASSRRSTCSALRWSARIAARGREAQFPVHGNGRAQGIAEARIDGSARHCQRKCNGHLHAPKGSLVSANTGAGASARDTSSTRTVSTASAAWRCAAIGRAAADITKPSAG